MYRSILLFGAPGAGKGTQGKILGTLPHYLHCACGEVFRTVKTDTPLGRMFQDYSSRGELVPDTPTVELWREFIAGAVAGGRFRPERDTLVLDGIPRNRAQAELLKATLDVRAVLYLRPPNIEVLLKRLEHRSSKEHRMDDASLKVIRSRLETYERETKPVLECYPASVVHEINCDQTPVKVLFDILSQLVKI